MRFLRLATLACVALLPLASYAQSGLVDSQTTLSELSLLIAQYDSRIKKLEAENAVLRYEMARAGITIPLTALSGSTAPLPTVAPVIPTKIPSSPAPSPVTPTPPVETIGSTTLTAITTQYGKDVSGFISRINKDWLGIKSTYALPSGARLAGYEFVQTGSNDYVFADIVVGSGSSGIYDIKILYQYEKSEYKRKLIGIFDYNPATARYTTRTGSNPFGGVFRIFVRDPYYAGTVKLPVTVSTASTGSTSASVTTTPTTPTPTAGSITASEITKAYNEKRYLSTISLSNTYLEKNPATVDILNIRYRTYFIIGKYSESLAELAKIEKLGSIDKQTACNAQVIATYSKNQALVDKYTAICKK